MCAKSLPCGLIAGKSLMLLAIVVENSFRSPNGKLYNLRTDEFTSGHSDVRSVPAAYAIMRGMQTNDTS